jgi:acetylornithine deacetylase/succinyl-diaminopimelate desuccinylase-like protein
MMDLRASFDRDWSRFHAEWCELLRFPSISAVPAHHGDCLHCASWLERHLAAIGFAARQLDAGPKPAVYAERKGDAGAPTVLLYGHYDVQPVDPVASWKTPPFEPSLRDGRLFARGAQDNKGQLFYVLKAIETLLRANRLRPTVRILVEGEEECGSVGIAGRLPTWRELLKADYLMVCDTGSPVREAPAIIMGLRGILNLSIRLRGPSHDLHSGVHGGKAPNPALGMARLLASLHDDDGRVRVAGFYDGVREPSAEERRLAGTPPYDAARYRQETGVAAVGGERAYTPAERVGFRPCLDANGMRSGYAGAGVKTIIPADAEAKLTARLVPGQDPQRCLLDIIAHVERHVPEGMALEIVEKGVSGGALRVDPDAPGVAMACAALREVSGREPIRLWEGASIPIVAGLRDVSGAEPILAGFGLEEDSIHAPNESFSIEQFRNGYLYAGLLLQRLGGG